MFLEKLRDGASRHLFRYRNDEELRQLIFILCLPLVDGVFATLLVSGALETFSDMLAVSLTVFCGAGALAVLYSHSNSRRDAMKMVLRAAPVLLAGALLVSLVAPVYRQMFYVEQMSYAAGIALIVVASQLLEVKHLEDVSPSIIILTGMALSLKNPGSIAVSLEYLVPAVTTASVSITALLTASILAHRSLNLERIRRGGALVLLIIGASLFGLKLPPGLELAVLGVFILASVDQN